MSGEWREVTGPGGAFGVYLERPAAPPVGAVVVIQEIFGVNANLRGKCAWLAKNGFLAAAPDLFWRTAPRIELDAGVPAELNRAFELYSGFDVDAGVGDIAATIAWLRGEGAGKVGAMGYCLGGLLAYMTACRTDADACVGYYGVGIEQRLEEAAKLHRPLMLHIAGKDQFVPPPAQAEIHAGLGHHAMVTLHLYAEQDHAFTREGGDHFDAHAAELADMRTVAFLRQGLGR